MIYQARGADESAPYSKNYLEVSMEKKGLIDKALELGLGIAAYSEEKLAEFLKEVTAKGETKREDVAKFKEEFLKKGATFRKEFAERIKKEVEYVIKKMNLATSQDLEELKKRIESLEEKE